MSTLPPAPAITHRGQVNKGMCWTTEKTAGELPAALIHLQSVQNASESHSAPFSMVSGGLPQRVNQAGREANCSFNGKSQMSKTTHLPLLCPLVSVLKYV